MDVSISEISSRNQMNRKIQTKELKLHSLMKMKTENFRNGKLIQKISKSVQSKTNTRSMQHRKIYIFGVSVGIFN